MRNNRPTLSSEPADAILSADWHLRDDSPPCRTDYYPDAQWDKLRQLRDLQRENADCPVLVAGDVFHHWKPSPALLTNVIYSLKQFSGPIIVIPGQHDLPAHSLQRYGESGLAVLETAGVVKVLGEGLTYLPPDRDIGLVGFPWGTEPGPLSALYSRNVALVHRFVYPGQPPFPGAERSGGTAQALLRQMQGFDLVVTGDYHKTFGASLDGSVTNKHFLNGPWVGEGSPLLVNPGSLGRQTADQQDHEPCVFLWWARDNRVQRHVLNYNKGAVTREHLEVAEERDERMEAFVRRLGDDYDVGLSFEENVRAFLAQNEIRPAVRDLVWELMEGKDNG